MPVSEPETPHIPPPGFVPKKEMNCKACEIKFLNFNTWKQHQIMVHHMSIKDWTLVYEQRDALKRNRARKRYALCVSKTTHQLGRPYLRSCSAASGHLLILSWSTISMVAIPLWWTTNFWRGCMSTSNAAHYDHWFASKQMQIHCSLIDVAAVNSLGHHAILSRQHRLEKQRR